jgi:Ca2+-binding RTX toxin-like protein
LLNNGQSIGYTNSTIGYLRLIQNGNDALFQWDKDGESASTYGWATLLTLQNLNLTNTPLTADNFSPSSSVLTSLGGAEDSTIAINLSSSTNIASFKITSFSNGALYSDSGLTQALNINSIVPATSNAATVYFRPTANWSGTTSLQYSTIDTSNVDSVIGTTTTLTVLGVADAPTLTVANVTSNGAIPLSISSALTDTDGSESLDITIGGMNQSTSSLSTGSLNVNNDGLWHLTPAQLANLRLFTSQTSGTITLTVNAISKEIANPSSTAAATAKTLTISLGGGSANQPPVLTTPYLNQGIAYGKQWNDNLNFANHFSDPDGSTLIYTATLSDNVPLPSWLTLNNGSLVGIPPSKALVNPIIPITITATDGDLSTSANFTVTVLNFDAGNLFQGTTGNEAISGTTGIDTITYTTAPTGLSITLPTGFENIIGSSGNDSITGGNAAILAGGSGNDVYVISNAITKIIENLNGGTADEVQSSVDYDLSSIKNVEKLTLTGIAIKAIGANKNETLTGNSANNILDGRTGQDTMNCGTGDDTYYVDNVGDVIIDSNGNDTVISLITALAGYTLPTDVENLTLMGKNSRSSMQGTGNSASNFITASAGGGTLKGLGGNDTLIGGIRNDKLVGGLGSDSLVGGAGKNVYIYQSAADSNIGNVDHIVGTFDGGAADKIQLVSGLLASNLNIIAAQSALNLTNTLSAAIAQFSQNKLNVAILTTTTDSKTFFAIDIDGDAAFTSNDLLIDMTGSALTSVTAATFKVTAPLVTVVPSLSLTASATSVNEGSSVIYTVTSNAVAPLGGLTVPYTLSGTATNGTDYTGGGTGTITIAAGATTSTLTLATVADNTTEGAETITMTLGTVSGANITTGSVTTTINNTSVTAVNHAPTLAIPASTVFNPTTGHSYLLSTSSTWQDAENEAVALGGHLVTINDQAENDWLANTFGTGFLWIGYTDQETEGTFVWANGETTTATYTNWSISQPDNAWAGQDYAYTNFVIGGTWDDIDTNSLLVPYADSSISLRGIIEIIDTNVISLAEDTTKTFQLSEFGSDVDGNLASVTITSLPVAGTLKLDSVDVTTHQVIPIASISTLTYTPPANANGINYASIGYTLTDSGNLTTAGTLSLNVTAVNDAPTGSITISGTPILGQTLTADTSSIVDADGLGDFTYHWKKTINGTTSDIVLTQNQSTLPLTQAEVGAQISVVVTYTDGGGKAESVTSNVTNSVFPADTYYNSTTSHYYYLDTTPMTWQGAEVQAVTMGGHLVTVNDETENAWLASTFGANGELWIGYTDEIDTFKWADGSTSTYTNWQSNEPSDAYTVAYPTHANNHLQDYAVINYLSAGWWDDQGSQAYHQGIIEIVGTP